MVSGEEKTSSSLKNQRTRRYILYLVIFMGMIAIMDQYLSFMETVAIPEILKEYNISASQFSWWEALYFIPTFFIFLLNGLTDIIGRKLSILILFTMMGFSSLAIVFLTPSFHFFMLFLAIITFTTVSNMWTIPISEEAPAEKRAKLVSIVYGISLLPIAAILPLLIDHFSLGWRWYYGTMFFFMIPVFIMWIFMKETYRYEIIKEERRRGVRKRHFFGLGVINRCDMRYILFSAVIWMCWLIVSLIGGKYIGYYFVTVNLYPQASWLLIFLGILLLMMVGSFVGGWTMDKIGRKKGLIIGCIGLGFFMGALGVVPFSMAKFIAPVTGFFLGFSYTWIIVYITEIFPTERRGSCIGWTTTTARGSYVIGPIVAAILLDRYPTMDWFWVITGLLMLIPIILVFLFHPFETRRKELEEIEEKRQSSS
ncbi:MAG TPA: MFS transporter [Candidatus Thermoplasmatota archaeon]|nr:MFS transporter [Candidatus Thermoplasmatota archaeon]